EAGGFDGRKESFPVLPDGSWRFQQGCIVQDGEHSREVFPGLSNVCFIEKVVGTLWLGIFLPRIPNLFGIIFK
ncbi:MAG: hypothetical protein RSB24_04405, partial [Akkermansia sp.]